MRWQRRSARLLGELKRDEISLGAPAWRGALEAEDQAKPERMRDSRQRVKVGAVPAAFDPRNLRVARTHELCELLLAEPLVHPVLDQQPGNLAEALTWCDRSIAADKLDAATHFLRSTILQEQALLEEATSSQERALYLDQTFVLAHFALGTLCLKQNKVQAASKHLKNALCLLKGHPAEEILPGSEGINTARLTEMIRSIEAGVVST